MAQWREGQAGTDMEERKKRCLGSARYSWWGSAALICNSNVKPGVLQQVCAGPGTSVSLPAQCGGGGE